MAARKATGKTNKVSKKVQDLATNTESADGQFITTNQGVRYSDDHNSLKAGDRGPSLLEDFIFREKMTHFDHERIPERIVHARGVAAHGVFKLYKDMSRFTKAGFLTDTGRETPVFVRFSTVAGSRGSTDLARDVRGFAVKFYTEEGNFDLVGNNMPVFFIQDAQKFPDFVHAVKPEPHNEIPQAASAHDTFWDFVSLNTESTHMVLWAMSDRAIPRSLRMMEGFGVHTFRLINAKGEAFFVKWHWKPLLGMHQVAWDEATIISGKDPDFHRRDLFEAIEMGNFPEWELGLQIVPEADEHKFPFDLLDPTKIIPEELVPVQRIGRMTLNRNPDNFFAETEQVAFHVAHIVPGIDFTNDPLMQGRLFSYTDTQLSRLGGPNFHEIPINRPIAPVHNNQRDGIHRMTINQGKSSYTPNTVGGGCPFLAGKMDGGFASYTERIDAHKVRARSKSFFDHFSQAALFYNSQSEPEKLHIINAIRFELGKVETKEIRERMLGVLNQVDKDLAAQVAYGLGMKVPPQPKQLNFSVPADVDPKTYQPLKQKQGPERSGALSMIANSPTGDIRTRKVAVLVADGVREGDINAVKKALAAAGAMAEVIAPRGVIKTAEGGMMEPDKTLRTVASVLYDAVYVPGGANSAATLEAEDDAVEFLNQAYKHCKPLALSSEADVLLQATRFAKDLTGTEADVENGVVVHSNAGKLAKQFVTAMGQYRFWQRELAKATA
ncbi:catalase [Flavisolibacter nicotianae]|uniref:catalase n=1 Tax=Flavisolibacter nicotianae TaxID=2364882 RepID=UPI000EABE371|nr:catalase [Flavisolibacter nicotianae]